MNNNTFLSKENKKNTFVNFSKNDIKNHTGTSGLKYYLIVMYLRKHLEIFGEVSFTLNKLLDECGYSTKTHNTSIYSDFKNIIKTEIIDKGFASCNEDIIKINPLRLIVLELSPTKNIFYTDDNFVGINVAEYEKITSSNIGKTNKAILLGVYLYIKHFIPSDKVIPKDCPRLAYPSKQQIKKGVGISSLTTIESAISILEELGMIYVDRDTYIESPEEDGVYIRARNVYALEKQHIGNDGVIQALSDLYGKPVCRRCDIFNKLTL